MKVETPASLGCSFNYAVSSPPKEGFGVNPLPKKKIVLDYLYINIALFYHKYIKIINDDVFFSKSIIMLDNDTH